MTFRMRQPLTPAWRRPKPIIGMVHLQPLPGSPGWSGSFQQVLDAALRDAETLAAGGVDGIIVENYGDIPFHPEHVPAITIAALTAAVLDVRRAVDIPVGVNVLRNDAAAAMAIAAATGAKFIRVNVHTGAMLTDQGWIAGAAHQTMRDRAAHGGDVAVFAANAGDPDQAAAAVAHCVDRFGGLDILVNNAATNPYFGPTMEIDLPRYDKTWEVNHRGVLVWIQHAWHAAMAERGGTVINIASVGGLSVEPGIGIYNGTKAALIHLTQTVSQDWCHEAARIVDQAAVF